MKKIILSALILLSTSSAWSASAPVTCKHDTRIRCVKYDQYEVYPITASFGYSVSIYFSPGEIIADMGGGDIEAWTIGVLASKDGFFIKPKSDKPASDVQLVTMKNGVRRDYTFDFNVEKFKKAEDRTYKVFFQYPDDAVKAKEGTAQKVDTEKLLRDAAKKKPKNEDYWFDGSEDLAPKIAWDDGQFTYFRFAPNAQLPAIYYVAPDGSENKVNKHMGEPNTVVVEMVNKEFRLRREQLVTSVYNQSYDGYGIENVSRTVSPAVTRVTVSPVDTSSAPAAQAGISVSPLAIPNASQAVTVPTTTSGVNIDTNPVVQEVLRANQQQRASDMSIDISRPGQRLPAAVTQQGK